MSKEKINVGDIVICIDDKDWNSCGTNLYGHTINLVYNKTYKVLGISTCNCDKSFDIGSRYNYHGSYTTCRYCGDKLNGNDIHWAGGFRFRKATPEETKEYYKANKEEIQKEIDACVAVENYEKAAELHKLLEN